MFWIQQLTLQPPTHQNIVKIVAPAHNSINYYKVVTNKKAMKNSIQIVVPLAKAARMVVPTII